MKSSKAEIILSLSGSLFLFIGIFRKPLGLSEAWDWTAPALAIVCFIPLFILQRRRRNARLAGNPRAQQKRPTARRFWLLLSVIVVGSLFGPFWLPYTGVRLPFSTLIVSSIISCILSVTVFLLAWRYWWPKF
jgi:Na+/H+ antiporter NhaD/arsenite permease-like protein